MDVVWRECCEAEEEVAKNLVDKLVHQFDTVCSSNDLWLEVPDVDEVEAIHEVEHLNLYVWVPIGSCRQQYEQSSPDKEY